jgi:hypothetical protein
MKRNRPCPCVLLGLAALASACATPTPVAEQASVATVASTPSGGSLSCVLLAGDLAPAATAHNRFTG